MNTKQRPMKWGGMLLAAAFVTLGAIPAFAGTKVGDVVTPGKKVVFTVDIKKDSIESLQRMGFMTLTKAQVGLWVPGDFDPSRKWNVLVVSATDNASSVDRMDGFVKAAEAVDGWIVMAADGTIRPDGKNNEVTECDTYRYAMMRAGLRALEDQWPAAKKWPVAVGGFSGGAKRSGYMSVILMWDGYSLIGMWMGGCNENTPGWAMMYNDPGESYLDVPIYLSVGNSDEIASLSDVQEVRNSMEACGFKNIRMKTYGGGHSLFWPHVAEGLQWFSGRGVRNGTIVGLDPKGGGGGSWLVDVTYGRAMPSIKPPTRAKHVFAGYFSEPYGAGTQYYDQTGAGVRSCDISVDTILYAAWWRANYKVAFDPNGGTGRMSAQGMTYGKAKKLRKNAFARSGYVFAGWAERKGGPVAYKDAASVKNLTTKGGKVVLYAVWAKPAYKVKFLTNGGTGKMAVEKFTYGKAKKLSANKFKRKGYTFKGWAKSKALAKKGKVAYKNKKSVKNLVTTGKTVKLYAVWKKK